MDLNKRFQSGNRRRLLWILAGLLFVVVLVIVVPIAVVLPKRAKPTTHILLPLYIYPTNSSSWQPLYDALDARPDVDYTIIINPKSGPVSDAPDDQFATELQRLGSYSNVQTVGYVRTGYATRKLSDVVSEINLYAHWSSVSSNYTMEGIFFDESPHDYSADAVEFMRSATEAVKKSKGIQGAKTVIRNPGVVPDKAFADKNTDISVVFEESYTHYQFLESNLTKTLSSVDRSHYCYMVNSVPSNMSSGYMKKWIGKLSQKAAYLFVTSNDVDYYESFGEDWSTFVGSMPTGQGGKGIPVKGGH